MALTQTCLIEFPLVTERLPTIRKKKDSKNGGINLMMCESSVATVTLRKYDASHFYPCTSLLNGPMPHFAFLNRTDHATKQANVFFKDPDPDWGHVHDLTSQRVMTVRGFPHNSFKPIFV